MKTIVLSLALVVWGGLAGGCRSVPLTEFSYQAIRLAVGGRVEPGASPSAADLGGSEDSPVLAFLDIPNRQVLIEARILSTSRREQSILGVDWVLGGKEVVRPAALEDATPKAPAVSLGVGLGTSLLGGRQEGRPEGHPPGCTCPQCRGSGSGQGISPAVGTGVSVPLGGDTPQRRTGVRAVFQHPQLLENVGDSNLLITVSVGQTGDGRVLLQPVLLPLRLVDAGAAREPPAAPTFLVIKEGQTLVTDSSGGSGQDASKVPVLGNLPVLSRFFTAAGDRADRKELVVFITPHVLVQGE